jgi:hypothetical protein
MRDEMEEDYLPAEEEGGLKTYNFIPGHTSNT